MTELELAEAALQASGGSAPAADRHTPLHKGGAVCRRGLLNFFGKLGRHLAETGRDRV